MPSKELIEKVAQAIMSSRNDGGWIIEDWDAERKDDSHVDQTIRQAQSAIATILAALQEPSEHMLAEAMYLDRPIYVWRAMLAASALGEQIE